MGSYDFGSGKVHFYSCILWSSHWRASKTVFARLSLAPVCDWSTMDNRQGFSPCQEEDFLSEWCHSPVQSSSPAHRFYLGVWRHPLSPWAELWVLFHCLREWLGHSLCSSQLLSPSPNSDVDVTQHHLCFNLCSFAFMISGTSATTTSQRPDFATHV